MSAGIRQLVHFQNRLLAVFEDGSLREIFLDDGEVMIHTLWRPL